MRFLFVILFIFSSSLFFVREINAQDTNSYQKKLFEKIIKITSHSLSPDYINPWNSGKISQGTGTGFLVGDNLFLTNAHVVSNTKRLIVNKYGDSKKYVASIVHIAHDCDLALISLADPFAFKGVEPLKIGKMPKIESTVTVLGYPIGGDRISITRGVVSRINFTRYSHSVMDYHLSIQIDAAINPGNSGGPAMQNGEVIGVSYQGFQSADNIGYIIPTPVINRFLKDVEDGTYDNYVDLACYTFSPINPAMRKTLGLVDDGIGFLVTKVLLSGSSYGVLKEGDVMMKIDEYEIDSDGKVWIDDERVLMAEIVERKFVGDEVKIDILRNGKRQIVKVKLSAFKAYLLQAPLYDKRARFIMFAGLLFQPLSRNLRSAYSLSNIEVNKFYINYQLDNYIKERPEPVILTRVLPDEINTHMTGYAKSVVDTINGVKILSLQDVYDALYNSNNKSDFHVIKLVNNGRPLILEKARVEESHKRVKNKYGIKLDHHIGELFDYVDKKLLEEKRKEIEEEKTISINSKE